MIAFRSMTEKEFPAYLDYFIPDYADEIVTNYGLTLDDALLRAQKEIADALHEGVNTHGQKLLCLTERSNENDRHVGYLWYKPDTLLQTVFIYDFHIFNACQGQGLGKQALGTFEEYLREKGFKEIRLRVAGDNVRARHVYETRGFGVTGINMSKMIAG